MTLRNVMSDVNKQSGRTFPIAKLTLEFHLVG